jgi:hypothetical protein
MFFRLTDPHPDPYPDPLITGTDPAPATDPVMIMQK